MKNLFFALAFMLIGSFTFANTNKSVEKFSEPSFETLVLENSNDYTLSLNEFQFSNSEFLALADCTLRGKFKITFSDGSSYSWEGTLTIVGQSCAEFLKEMMAD